MNIKLCLPRFVDKKLSDIKKVQTLSRLNRYNAKSVEDKENFMSKVALFIRMYSFVMQVCRMLDFINENYEEILYEYISEL